MEIKQRHVPLGVMIALCIVAIGGVGAFLIIHYGNESWLTALAYLIAATAIAAGGCVAYRHLRIIQGTERATVLTSLDTSWAGSELEKSRVSILELKREFRDIEDITERKTHIKDKLRELQESDIRRYRELVAMVCFFETVGYFSRVGYILPRDALELYGPAIRNYDDVFREYILELQTEDKDKEIYANFLWLANVARLK